MGTNYYFKIKNSEALSGIISKVVEFLTPEQIQEKLFNDIHICKISAGWKPLFKKTEYFDSTISLLEFYDKNSKMLEIINEDYEKISIDVLQRRCHRAQNDKGNETHYDYEKDSAGYAWTHVDFC